MYDKEGRTNNMKIIKRRIFVVTMAMTMLISTAFPAYAAQFGSRYDANGVWSNTSNLTWTFNAGGDSVTVGRGPVFSDVHPEITDPEYFLKESILYPGETIGTQNSTGGYKSDYSEALPFLQEFVNSFDWIHSDELTRVQKVFERIANGQRGNTYGDPVAGSFSVLQYSKGVCMNFAGEFQRLAEFVGLECVTYAPSEMHVACLVKIGSQWIVVDPTNATSLYDNSYTVPVDYEIEYNRYSNEVRNSDWYKKQMEQVEWQRQAEAGEITWIEYYQRIYPGKTIEEIEEICGFNDPANAEYYHDLASYQEFMDSLR